MVTPNRIVRGNLLPSFVNLPQGKFLPRVCRTKTPRIPVLSRAFRLILCCARGLYVCIKPLARLVLTEKHGLKRVSNQTADIFDDILAKANIDIYQYNKHKFAKTREKCGGLAEFGIFLFGVSGKRQLPLFFT